MAQQTAVELLFEQLWETPKDKLNWYAILKKAKAMEKEQIEKAFSIGQETPINHPTLPHYSREEYYNEMYQSRKD
jgi:hypothetical protein